ncbi:hypothetical protein IH781_03600 [Patescibacteria group bacterium]|nr:hypothetical protein [Patescibacteria group bacterium]
MYQHVHMGAGAFGLGFVVPLVAQAGFQTVLTNRARGSTAHVRNMAIKANAGYDLVLRGAHTKTEPIPITEFVFLDEDKDRFLEVVADPKTSLLTTALRQGFRSSIPILAAPLANRLQT